MSRLLHHMSLTTPAILISLLLLEATLAPAAATATETPEKKIRMKIRHANKEEAQWLDRYAETHEPLGASPLKMVRATPEQEHWLNRLSNNVGTTKPGEDGAGGSSYMDFDDDNPYVSSFIRAVDYVDALRDWVSHLTKQSMEKAGQAENPLEDL